MPTEVAVCVGVGPACQTLLPLAFQSGSWATFPPRRTVPYTLSWPAVPGSTLLHSAFMWVGDMLGKVVSRKMCGPLGSRESMQLLGSALPGFRSCKPPWLRLSERPWDHKPLRRQSLSPWQGCRPCPLNFTLLGPEPDQLANYGYDSLREV